MGSSLSGEGCSPWSDAVNNLQLHRLDSTTWIIRNGLLDENDPHHVVACISDSASTSGVEVVWIEPTPLPVRSLTAETALHELRAWLNRSSGPDRPVPISHFAPPPGCG